MSVHTCCFHSNSKPRARPAEWMGLGIEGGWGGVVELVHNLPIALGIWFQLKWKSEVLDWIIGVEPLNGQTFL